MIALVMAAAIGIAASDAPNRTQDLPRLCQIDFQSQTAERRFWAWLNLFVDGNYAPISADVHVRTDEFDAGWEIDDKRLSMPGKLKMFEYFLAIPADSQFPVKVSVLLDGRKVAETQFSTASGASRNATGSVKSRLLRLSEREVPDFYGKNRIEFRAIDRAGTVSAIAQLSLPDWSWLAMNTRSAGRAATRERLGKVCGPAAVI